MVCSDGLDTLHGGYTWSLLSVLQDEFRADQFLGFYFPRGFSTLECTRFPPLVFADLAKFFHAEHGKRLSSSLVTDCNSNG